MDSDSPAFTRYFRRAPVGMAEVALDGRVVRVNDAFAALVGADAESLGGRAFEALLHPDDHETARDARQRVAAGAVRFETRDVRLAPRSGRERWVQQAISLERPGPGAPTVLLIVLSDLSARREVEQALLRRTSELHTAQRVAGIGSWEIDHATNVMRASPEVFRMLEWEDAGHGTMTFETLATLWHPQDAARVGSGFAAAVAACAPFESVHRMVTPRGRIKYLRVLSETLPDAQGRPRVSIGTAQDVTRQRLTELGLRSRELHLFTILSSLRDFVALLRLDDDAIRITEINPAGLELLVRHVPQTTRADLPGLNLEALAPEVLDQLLLPSPLRPVLSRVCESGTVTEFEAGTRPDAPQPRYAEVSLTPVLSDDPQQRLVLLVSHDVTERRRSEEMLRRSLLEKETLLSEVHHRVKNNLQIISSMLALQSGGGADATTRALLEEARNRIHTMALVHEQLYSTHDFASVDLARHLDALSSMVAGSMLQREGVVLRRELSPAPVSLEEAIPLGLAVNELLSNAWKHAFTGRAGGTVTVTCAADAEAVRVCVRDDGIGLPSEDSLAQARTLGFRIVRTLIAQLRAKLEIDRASGTAFTIIVPRERPS